MTALYILAAVVLVLFLLGQVRVGGQAVFNAEGFFLWVRIGGFRIKIFPAKAGTKKKTAPKPKKKKRAEKASRKPAKKKTPEALPEKIGGALEYAQALLPVALKAAQGMLRSLRVDTLELELTAGAPDPADAAMVYGQANAALGALWYPLTAAFRVKDGHAQVRVAFDAPGTTVYGTAALSIQLGAVVWIGLRAGSKALFTVFAARRRLKSKRQQRKAA